MLHPLIYLHSTLIKYKVWTMQGSRVIEKNDLHSTLIKYKVNICYLSWLSIHYLHSTLIKYKAKSYQLFHDRKPLFTFHSD